MAKILNLDTLAVGEVRELHWKGVVHKINAMSVEDFVAINASIKRLSGDDTPVEQHIDEGIKILVRLVPSLNPEELRKLPFDHLNALSAFVRGENVEGQTDSTEAEASEGK